MEAATGESVCFHCGGPLGSGADCSVRIEGIPRQVCCAGCEAAAHLILSQGLERFYAFREASALRPPDASCSFSIFDRAAALRRYTHELPNGERELSLEIEGLHCAACAWLIERSLGREAGVHEIHVNPGGAACWRGFARSVSCHGRCPLSAAQRPAPPSGARHSSASALRASA